MHVFKCTVYQIRYANVLGGIVLWLVDSCVRKLQEGWVLLCHSNLAAQFLLTRRQLAYISKVKCLSASICNSLLEDVSVSSLYLGNCFLLTTGCFQSPLGTTQSMFDKTENIFFSLENKLLIKVSMKLKVVYWFHFVHLSVRPSFCPSVRQSVSPSVEQIMSAMYYPQCLPDLIYIYTSYQPISEGMPHIMVQYKF